MARGCVQEAKVGLEAEIGGILESRPRRPRRRRCLCSVPRWSPPPGDDSLSARKPLRSADVFTHLVLQRGVRHAVDCSVQARLTLTK